jgi:DegV family protein with EDD domain
VARVRLVTDSTADIPAVVQAEHNIEMVPLDVEFGNDVYKDQVELSPDEFYRMLTTRSEHPKTSQPSPGDFGLLYKKILDAGDEVVSVHLSKELSGTFQAASLAASSFTNAEISLLDSKLASIALGIPVIEGAIAAERGASRAEVVELVGRLCKSTHVFFAVDTLEYLYRNGRIGRASHLLGSLLSMKPVLTLEDGSVVAYDKVRGKRKAIARMVEALQERIPAGKKMRLAVAHARAKEEVAPIAELLKGAFGSQEIIFTEIGAVIGTHVGPGTIAVAATVLE